MSSSKNDTDFNKVFALLVIACLVFLREPNLLINPRFWAEEGPVWFEMAYGNGFLDSLLYVPSTRGYFDIAANLCVALASRVPLEYAPHVTTYLSYAYLLVLFAVILWNESDVLQSFQAKLIACGIVLFASTNHEEIWLTSVHIMGFAGICSLFVLLDDPSRAGSFKKHAYRALLAFNTLTGPYTTILIVPFFMRLALEAKGRKERAVQFGIVFVCVLIQVSFFLLTVKSYGFEKARAIPFSFYESAVYVCKWQLLDPVLGIALTNKILNMLGVSIRDQGVNAGSVIGLGLFCMAFLVTSLFLLWRGNKGADQRVLIVSYVAVAAFTAYFSLNRMPLNRYAVLPGAIVLLALLNVARHQWPGIRAILKALRKPTRRALTAVLPGLFIVALLSLALTRGIENYWQLRWNNDTNVPLWRDEVAKWRLDHRYELKIFPESKWKVRLEPKD